MASEVQVGRAYIHGIRNDGTAIGLSGYATFTLDTVKLDHKFDSEFLKDEIGFDAAGIATNEHIECAIAWMPTGATRAAAAATAAFLSPYSKVTLSHFELTIANGDWLYIGDASIDLSKKEGKMALKLRRYVDDVQNASMTTTVNG